MTERRKLFSQPSSNPRRKLFSNQPSQPTRRKLFCDVNMDQGVTKSSVKTLVCQDCGYSFDTIASASAQVCPHCGGNRFNELSGMSCPEGNKNEEEECKCPEKTYSRRSLFDTVFQKEFSTADTNMEQILTECSGKSIGVEELDKLFSDHNIRCNHQDIIERGYAKLSEDGKEICFSDTAFTQEKLFSKLIITVTKELDLDPVTDKAAMISKLEEEQSLSPKGIYLLKKAHSLPQQIEFSESYLQDSGIENDLKLEYGGTQMELSEFKKLLSEQYDDAPENILDLLIQKGVIKIFGDKVEILK